MRLEKAPDVFAHLGWERVLPFISHPGVLAFAALLNQKSLVQWRAHFTDDVCDQMKHFDVDLYEHSKIALKEKLPVTWKQLDHLPEHMTRLKAEYEQIRLARSQVLGSAVGNYSMPNVDYSVVRPSPGNPDVGYKDPNKPTTDVFKDRKPSNDEERV